jgi:TRAP-type C4-dicarboxylate transport system substrate-binding protein
MKKKVLLFGFMLVLAVGMTFTACGGGGNANESADAGDTGVEDTSGGETTVTAEPIVIKVNNFMPQGIPPALGTVAAGEKLAELSGGTMTTEEYYNGTLLGFNDSWQGTAEGAVDVAIMAIATIDSNTILNNAFSTPAPNLSPDQVKTTELFNALVDAEPSLNEEMAVNNLRWLAMQAMPNYNIHLSNKVIPTPADIKGVKIEGLGANTSKYLENMGATTVSLDPGDYYISCERGVVDGMLAHWACVNDYKVSEVLHYHTIFGEYTPELPAGNGLSSGAMGYAVNLDTWNSLTAEQQGWLQEAFRYGGLYSAELDHASSQAGYQSAIDNGDEILNITGDDLKPWIDAMQTVVDEWVAKSEAAGFTTAAQIRETLIALTAEYQ